MFHGSKTGLEEIKDNYNPYGLDFGGVFGSVSKTAAESHGDKLYSTKIKKSDILDQGSINNLIDKPEIEQLLIKNTKINPKNKNFQSDLDLLKRTVLQNESLFDLDAEDAEKIQKIVRKSDLGEADWELQVIRGKVAKSLGYKAVEMPDEHGISYLVFPGNKITEIK